MRQIVPKIVINWLMVLKIFKNVSNLMTFEFKDLFNNIKLLDLNDIINALQTAPKLDSRKCSVQRTYTSKILLAALKILMQEKYRYVKIIKIIVVFSVFLG